MTESHVHVIKLKQNDRITCARHKVNTESQNHIKLIQNESHVHVKVKTE